MDNRRDHYTSSHDFHSYQISHSGLLEDPFIQPTEAPLLPTGVALTADSVRNYDLYSAVDTWMTSGFFSQLPEPMPVQMLNNATSWGLGATEDCMFNPSQVSKVLAPEGSNYPFSVDGDNCMDSPSSTDSFPDLSQPTYHLANSSERDMFSSESKCGAEIYAPSTPFLEDQGYSISFTPGSHQQQPERPVSGPDGTSIGPSSPAPSISSHQSLEPRHAVSPVTAKRRSTSEGDDVEACYGDTDEDGNNDPPYSLLIYQALTSAPGMKLPLQGIYSWFEKNTTKGKDQNSKGWQNSIRHNLSMNAVCIFAHIPTKMSLTWFSGVRSCQGGVTNRQKARQLLEADGRSNKEWGTVDHSVQEARQPQEICQIGEPRSSAPAIWG